MAQETSGLENQLRNMILGNVTIGNGQTNQDSHSSQPQRGRGRGRGGFVRGSNRNHEPQHGHNTSQSFDGSGAHRGFRGSRNNFNNHPDARYRHPRGNSQHQSGPIMHQNGSTAQEGRQNAPRPPRQMHSNNPAPSLESQAASGGHPSRILQRPSGGGANMQGQGQMNSNAQRHPHSQASSYPYRPHTNQPRENPAMQIDHLDHLALQEIPKVQMETSEYEEKETFRKHLESIFQQAFAEGYSGELATISLVSFGSLASGFAMPGSDMDLAVVPGWKDSSRPDRVGIDRDIPRLFEQAVLDAKMGGRLLTRTRVPILKVCQNPMDELYTALVEERKKWNELPEEEQYPGQLSLQEPSSQPKPPTETSGEKRAEVEQHANIPKTSSGPTETSGAKVDSNNAQDTVTQPDTATKSEQASADGTGNATNKDQNHRGEKSWAREKILGPLDFPKTGVGIQCDINFENPLGVHNTHLLRCYSLCDSRVQPIVLFVKSWAKTRKINSSYSGTLSSYGWVLMVLHYLVNIAQPPVCPNLQHSVPQTKSASDLEKFFKDTQIGDYMVQFWRDEQAITQAAQSGQLTKNTQSVGALLRGFFQYYASVQSYGYGPRAPQFYWTTEVLSLRSQGGIVTKQSKGWVSAKTIQTAEKKVTNRYLFAIEDPFEIDHNVARTVTHRGIVAIRDEFRRAWRILSAVGRGTQPEGGIFDEVVENLPPAPATATTKMASGAVSGESQEEKLAQK